MLLFGHVGITAAVVKISDMVLPSPVPGDAKKGLRRKCSSLLEKFRDSSRNIDYRMVIIGSMLPDIIDKPLFLIFGNNGFVDGRGFTHSLLFQLVLMTGGLLLRKSWLLLLAFAGLMHLALDSIWHLPVTLFWPFLGWFTPRDSAGWLSNIWENLISNPEVYVPEIIGLLIVVWFGYRIIRGKGIMAFLKRGRVD